MSVGRFAAVAAAAWAARFADAKYALRAAETLDRVNRDVVTRRLQDELRAALGHGESHERLAAIEAYMRPMVGALPALDDGGLDQSTARYALQRYFSGRHGWLVEGLESNESRHSNESVSTALLKSKLPSVVLDLLESRLEGKHVGLPDLAVFAATVEDLAHSDMMSLLEDSYGLALAGGTEDDWAIDMSELVLRGMMLWYTIPEAKRITTSPITLRRALRNAHKAYHSWDSVMLWAQDLESTLIYEDRTVHNPFTTVRNHTRSFQSLGRLVGVINEQFGPFQNLECKALKNKLMDLDGDRRDGRVSLAKFYGGHLHHGIEAFSESVPYLRALGALDESDPSRPSVIVPNYVYGKSNCIATSALISVCCISECSALMTNLEGALARPVASPAEIAHLVSRLPSETVAAPRNLSQQLLERLDEVAAANGGGVPLHGRLFAQWMHLAFPNECPFPQLSSAERLTPWHVQEGSQATKDQMWSTVHEAAAQNVSEESLSDFNESQLPWLHEEELLTEHVLQRLQENTNDRARTTLRLICMLMTVCGSIALLAGMQGSVRASKKRKQAAGVLPSWADYAADSAASQVRLV